MSDPADLLFEVDTPLGFSVRVSRSYWKFLVTIKHPAMFGREVDVQTALSQLDEVRRSRIDPDVYYSISRTPLAAGYALFAGDSMAMGF